MSHGKLEVSSFEYKVDAEVDFFKIGNQIRKFVFISSTEFN